MVTEGPPADAVTVMREVLAVAPAGCSWLLPERDDAGRAADFRIAAVSGLQSDVHGRGTSRVGALLTVLYPSVTGGPLWRLYEQVLATGEPGELRRFQYQQTRTDPEALFDVSVHPLRGGLLVWWQRLDEDHRRLQRTELLGQLGWAEYDLRTARSKWSPGMYRIFDREPALGPLSRTEQEIERLGDQLRSREITALAEHRLAGQLQNLIQPVPRDPFPLPGLQAAVSYLPPGVLLGAADRSRYPVVSVPLCPDDLALFYTDGLVERRDPGDADLLDEVMRTMSEVSAETGDLTLKRLRDLLPPAGPDDDTCTLAVRVLS